MPSPTITWPAGIIPANIHWQFPNLVGISQSPFTLQQQKYDWGFSAIRAKVQIPILGEAAARKMMAFLVGGRGRSQTFLFGDYRAALIGGQGSGGTATVSASNQTGNILVTSFSSGQVLPGDWIGLPGTNRMHMVTAVSGGTLTISPNIRESPASGATVTTNTGGGGTPTVQGLFQFSSNLAEFTQINPQYEFSFDLEEAW